MDWSSFDLNLLPVLRALLEEENVERAARRLGKSQGTVSAALGRLRAALGATVVPFIEPRLRCAGPTTLVVLPPAPELFQAEFKRGEIDLMLASRIPLPPDWMTRTLHREVTCRKCGGQRKYRVPAHGPRGWCGPNVEPPRSGPS